MGADDAKTCLRHRPTAQHKRNQRRAAAHCVIAPTRLKLPALVLIKAGKAHCLQALLSTRHCVPGAGASIDEVD